MEIKSSLDHVTFLVSTMDGILNTNVQNFNHIIYNQGKPKQKRYFRNIDSYGLSKSRNVALEMFRGDIGVIADNDVMYVKEVDKIISDAHKANQDAGIIVFQIKTPQGCFFKTNYPTQKKVLKKRDLWRVSSVEITFKKEIAEKLRFNERFGLGTDFPSGEELIFLCEALKNHKIIFVPEVIGIHPALIKDKMRDPKVLMAKGAMVKFTYPYVWVFILTAFALKKAESILHFFMVVGWGIKGRIRLKMKTFR